MRVTKKLQKKLKTISAYNKSKITKKKPFKKLTFSIKRKFGKTSNNRIVSRRKELGHKKSFRKIDFKRTNFLDVAGIIQSCEYDPYRTGFINLVKYNVDGKDKFTYILAAEKSKIGDSVISSLNAVPIKDGNSTTLLNVPIGTNIFNISLNENTEAALVRSAGTYAQIIEKIGNYASVLMPSKEIRKIHINAMCTLGEVSNIQNSNKILLKAGDSRHRGRRPHVRGVAMNIRDHPHGGGTGKSYIQNHPTNPQGKNCKGLKTSTRKRRNTLNNLISKKK